MHLASKSNEIEETHISITLQIPKTLILGIKFLILIFFLWAFWLYLTRRLCLENVKKMWMAYREITVF